MNDTPPLQMLVVEDDEVVRRLVAALLEQEGFDILQAECKAEAEALLRDNPRVALVLLDLNLPDGDGLESMAAVREHSEAPVIMLTVRDQPDDRIAGLSTGADDYITKPFDPRELLLRVRNLLSRSGIHGQGNGAGSAPCSIGLWEVDLGRRLVIHRDGTEAVLTRAEFDLLAALLSSRGSVLSRERLLESINREQPSGRSSDRTIDVLISRIRKKLETEPANPRWLITVPGIGYKLLPSEDG